MQNKTLKSLLVKFLSVLFALCCCLGLMFGLTGCGEDAKQIVETKINDKGELVIYYSDNSSDTVGVVVGGGTLVTGCDHEYVSYVAQQATCQVEEIKVDFCTKCNGYAVLVGKTNPDVHGTWSKEKVEEESNGSYQLVDKFVSAVEELPAKPTDVAGSCREKKCNLCGEFLETHPETTLIPVDNGSSICEEEYWAIKSCKVCKNPILDENGEEQITKEPARGHVLTPIAGSEVLDNKGTDDVKDDEYTVRLACSTCGKNDITAKATYNKDKSVDVNCQHGGYDIYTFTYKTYDEESETVVEKTEDLKKNVQGVSPIHVFKVDDYSITYNMTDLTISYTKDNAEALNTLIEKGIINPLVGEVRECDVYAQAVGTCALCNGYISLSINDEHVYGELEAGDCTHHSVLPCENCDHEEVVKEAIGHQWEISKEEDAIDWVNYELTLDCKVCDAELPEISFAFDKDLPATDCSAKSYKQYKTTETINNGLRDTDLVLDFKVVDETAPALHTYKIGDETIFTIASGDHKTWETTFASMIKDKPASIDDGYIVWDVAGAGNCQDSAAAYFKCAVCGGIVSIDLDGACVEVENAEMKKRDATCTENGYFYKDCQFGCEIVYDPIKADGHKYAIVSDVDFKAMVEANRNSAVVRAEGAVGTKIAIKCSECNDTKEAELIKIESKPGDPDSCYPATTYTYTFEYKYSENDIINKTDTFTVTSSDAEVKHVLKGVDDVFFKDVNTLAEAVQFNVIKDAFNNGDINWITGAEGTCKTAGQMIFQCAKCNGYIKIYAFAEHDLKEGLVDVNRNPVTDYVQPTCTEDGVTYQICEEGCLVPVKTISKTGHDFEFVAGSVEVVYTDGVATGVIFVPAKGTCKNNGCEVNANVYKEAETIQKILEAQNCCDVKTVEVNFCYDANGNSTIEESEILDVTANAIINPSDAHDYLDGVNYEKVITINGVTYKYCWEGNKYIKQ